MPYRLINGFFIQISVSPLNIPIPTPASVRGGPVAYLGGPVEDPLPDEQAWRSTSKKGWDQYLSKTMTWKFLDVWFQTIDKNNTMEKGDSKKWQNENHELTDKAIN